MTLLDSFWYSKIDELRTLSTFSRLKYVMSGTNTNPSVGELIVASYFEPVKIAHNMWWSL